MSSSSPSLTLYIDDQPVFQSDGKWLYPLFELEDYQVTNLLDLSHARIHDKVIGKAAAFLIVRLGIGHVHADLVSELGIQVLDRWRIPCSFGQKVEKIDCQTEAILFNVDDIDRAYQILCKRVNRSPLQRKDESPKNS
jgi:hypothetical protein